MLRTCTRAVVGGRQGRALMASLIPFQPSSSSSHLPPKPQLPPPTPAAGAASPSRFRLLFARAAARRDPEPPSPAPAEAPPDAAVPAVEERRSLAVRTGELFLGLAALLLRGTGARRGGGGGAAVEEVEARDGVVWEQRPEDVEAERRRRELTTPGFSFSAAGLLFPYHLGAAQCLMDKGYITERTPLAGSSAGAIICAVIASGNTMQDALQVTKDLADNCRSNGTAFRLGAVLRDVLDKFLPDDLHIRYLAPRPATFFRNRLCIDGGLTLFMPPTSASETVQICAFPASRLGL